jgi:ABC-type ATPase with predicted acetyltransferase domain
MFAQAKTPGEKGVWGRKIKIGSSGELIHDIFSATLTDFAFTRMTQDVRKHQDEMGETGTGITHEEEINMELDNTFTNKWGERSLHGATET